MHASPRRAVFAALALAAFASIHWLTSATHQSPAPAPAPAIQSPAAGSAEPPPQPAAPLKAAPPTAAAKEGQPHLERMGAAPHPAAIPQQEQPFAAFNTWMGQYLGAAPEARPALLESGRALAASRREALADLITRDPRSALEHAVPMVARQELPPEILDQLESRVSAKGFYGVLGMVPDPADPKPGPAITREAIIDGQRFAAHVYGQRLSQRTTENAHLTGIAVGRELALDERPLRVLEKGERPVAKNVFTTCPVSGKSVPVNAAPDGALPPVDESTPAVEIAGEVHYLCSGGHIIAVEEGILAGEGISGGATKPFTAIPSSQSTGVRSLLYLRVAFPDTQSSPQSEAAAYSLMEQVNNFFIENSFGSVYLVTTVAPLIVLPHSESWYNNPAVDGVWNLRVDALEAARKLGYDTDRFDLDIVTYTGGPGGFGGLAYVGGKGVWIKAIDAGVICHEVGHNFGLMHANFWETNGRSVIGEGSNAEYGNSYDTMGNANAGDNHFNAAHKAQINWLPARQYVHNVTQSGTYRILAMDQPRLSTDNRYALKIEKDSDREYWAEFRQKSFNSNRWTHDGILLNWSPWSNSHGGAQLLDTTPGTPDGRADAAIVIGRTFSDFESGIHITPIRKGGTAPESMDVVVNLGSFPDNNAPVLTSATASSATAALNAAVNFTASASDPDGDALSYGWDFGDRTFSTTNSPSVSKSWSAAGEYVVRCVVSDMKGGTASRSLVVQVGTPGTFRITGTITLNGSPLANVRVSNGASGSSYRGSYTDSDGSFVITGIKAGTTTLNASLEGCSFTAAFTNPISISSSFTAANFTASQTTRVTITATDSDCTEGAANPGKFTITRTGSTAADLTVNLLTPSGTAARGSDYTLTPALGTVQPTYDGTYATAVIPAGKSSVDLVLAANSDSSAEGPESVRLELFPGAGYSVGSNPSATILIQDANSTLPQISIRASDEMGAENGNPAALTISRTGSTAAALNVLYTVGGSATAGSDYTALSGTLSIPAGAASSTLTITPINDSLVEGAEDVSVSISSNSAYLRASGATSASITLIDDDRPTVTVTASDPAASEAPGDTGAFLFTRTGSTAQPLTVNYALSGSAAQGVDYLPVDGVLTIPAGASQATVTITPIIDGFGEPQQTVTLQLRANTAYAIGAQYAGTVTITDGTDRPVVSVQVVDGDVSEPSNGGRFRFSAASSLSAPITVHYTVTGTATPGVDYSALSGTVTLNSNGSADVTVTPLADTLAEDSETITVTIDLDPAYSSFLDASSTIYLRDDERPAVTIDATVETFSESSGKASFWVSRTGSTAAALTVNYTLAGTATKGVDYASLPGSITIPAGSSGVALETTAIEDALKEGSETLLVSLAPGSYGYGLSRSAAVYLQDNDAPAVSVGFSATTGSGQEKNGTVSLPVTLSAAASGTVTVEYLTYGGSATGSIDYRLTAGTLTFAPGETAKNIPLTLIDDIYPEASETIVVKLRYANGAALPSGTSTYTYTIVDNDSGTTPAGVTISATDPSASEPGTDTGAFTITRTGSLTAALTVNLTWSGTAISGSDYQALASSVSIPAGASSTTLTVKPLDDQLGEDSETVVASIASGSGYTAGSPASATVTIADNEPDVSITATDADAAELGLDPGAFTITRTGSTAASLSVAVVMSGTAAVGSDYTTSARPVVIPAGAASAVLTITPLADQLTEPDETITASIASGAYRISGQASASIILADDATNDAPVITLQSPATPAVTIATNVGLVLAATIADDGRPFTPGKVTTAWSTVSGPGEAVFADPASASTTASFPASGAYVIRLTADDGALTSTLDLAVTVSPVSTWQDRDIGSPGVAGSFTEANGAITVKGSGQNINGSSDQFHFVYQSLSGDGEIKARITSMSGGGNSAKAGIMLRNSLTAGSRAAFTSYLQSDSTQGSASYRTRLTDGGAYSATTNPGNSVFPAWLRLVRSAGNFTAYRSADGVTWTKVGSTRAITMDQTIFVGLGVCSNNNTALCTAVFDNITITRAGAALAASASGANFGPVVSAGPAQTVALPADAKLPGTVRDDGLPQPASLTVRWSKVSGPGSVIFADPGQAATTATFSAAGQYTLRLSANDGAVETFRDTVVTASAPAPASNLAGIPAAPAPAPNAIQVPAEDAAGTGTAGAASGSPASPVLASRAAVDAMPLQATVDAAAIAFTAASLPEAPLLAIEGPFMTLTYQRPLVAEGTVYLIEAWTQANGWQTMPATEEILADDGLFRLVKARVLRPSDEPLPLRVRIGQP